MTTLLTILAGGILGLLVGLAIKPSKKEVKKDYYVSQSSQTLPTEDEQVKYLSIPSNLGIRQNTVYSYELNNLRKKLDTKLDPVFMENVKKRVLSETKWTEKEYEVYLYGMKQFLLLNAVLKSVPMFSVEVDEIWHQMLMFTREYNDFSIGFAGEMIHHAPNTSNETKGDPGARAEFDWLYSQFFEVNEVSKFIYKGFFEYGLNAEKTAELEKMTEEAFQSLYFKETSEAKTIAKQVSTNLKSQFEQAKKERVKAVVTGSKSTQSAQRKQDSNNNYYDDYVAPTVIFADDNNYDTSDKSSSTVRCGSSCSSSSKSSCSSSSCSSSSSSCSSSSSSCSSSSCSSCSS